MLNIAVSVALLTVLGTALPVAAGPPPGCTPETTETPADRAPGLRAYVDPQTGELTEKPPSDRSGASTQQQTPRTAAQAAAPEPFVEVIRPDGSVAIDIGDRFLMELHAEVVNGKVVLCHRPADPALSNDHRHAHGKPPAIAKEKTGKSR